MISTRAGVGLGKEEGQPEGNGLHRRGLGPEEGYSRPGFSRVGLGASQVLPPGSSQPLPEQRTGEVRPCKRQRSHLSLEIEALRNLGMRAVSGGSQES